MSFFLSGTFGKISGRHGTAVAENRNGETILRLYTPPSNPRTPAQIAHRDRFAFVAKVLYPFRPVFKLTYGPTPKGFGMAFSQAYHEAVMGSWPEFQLNWAQLKIAQGYLTAPNGLSYSLNTNENGISTIALEWATTLYEGCKDSDLLHLVVFDPVSEALLFYNAPATRNNGNLLLDLPSDWQVANTRIWIFFSSSDWVKISRSIYLD